MSTSPHRAPSDQLPSAVEESFPTYEGFQPEPQFDQLSWTEARGEEELASAGGRMVLGWALGVLALLWTGYTAWSAGRSLADQRLYVVGVSVQPQVQLSEHQVDGTDVGPVGDDLGEQLSGSRCQRFVEQLRDDRLAHDGGNVVALDPSKTVGQRLRADVDDLLGMTGLPQPRTYLSGDP